MSPVSLFLLTKGNEENEAEVLISAIIENLRAGFEERIFGLGETLDLGACVLDEFIGQALASKDVGMHLFAFIPEGFFNLCF